MDNETLYGVYRYTDLVGAPPLEWAIRAHHNRLDIREGRSGELAPCTTVDPSSWAADSAALAKAWRRDQKETRGYVLAGFGEYCDDRLRLICPPKAAEEAGAIAKLHWYAHRAIERAPFERLTASIADGLTRSGVKASAQGERPGLSVETPVGTWAVSLQPDGKLSDTAREGSGLVLVDTGVVPMLSLMLMEREFPGSVDFIVWLASDNVMRVHPEVAVDDHWVGDVAGSFEKTLRVAQAMGWYPSTGVLAHNQKHGPEPMWF